MGSPGTGGTISAASDTNLNTPVTDDLFLRQGAYWANIPLNSRVALVDKGGMEKVVTADSGTGTYTVNLNSGNVFFITLTGNMSFAFTGATNAKACSFTLYTKQGATVRTVAWPSSGTLKWAGGTAGTVTATADKVDIFVFETIDGGTTWYGSLVGNNF